MRKWSLTYPILLSSKERGRQRSVIGSGNMMVTGDKNKRSNGIKSTLKWIKEKTRSKEKVSREMGWFLEGCESKGNFFEHIVYNFFVRMPMKLICWREKLMHKRVPKSLPIQ